MAIVRIDLPQCDVCGEVWLPDKRLPDGSRNPAREHPELSKRCGKCKTPRWNEKARQAPRNAGKKAVYENVQTEYAPTLAKPAETTVDDPKANVSLAGVEAADTSAASGRNPIPNGAGLEKLEGILADVFKELGGGEAFLKAERNWGPDVWERYEAEEKQRRERSA